MMSHRPGATTLRGLGDGTDCALAPGPETLRLPVDLLARQARCGRAGAGHLSLSGWVYDADHRPLGQVDATGIVRRGPVRVAVVEDGCVVRLDGKTRGSPLGSVRTVVRPEYEMVYLCEPRGAVLAFVLVDRRVCQLDHARLIQLAGAALALLGPRLER